MKRYAKRPKLPHVVVMLPLATKLSRDMRRGILRYAAINGPWIVHLVEGRIDEHTTSYLAPGKCDGIIGRIFSSKLKKLVNSLSVPKVLVDSEITERSSYDGTCDAIIRSDTQAVGRTAAQFFIDRGFARFAYVAPREMLAWSIRRGRAFARAVAAAGFPCDIYGEKTPGSDKADLERLAEWLRQLQKPIAVLAAYDQRAIEVVDACAIAGINIPEDIAILGVDDDSELDEALFPTLSSIAMDAEASAYHAAEELDRLMRRKAGRQGSRQPPSVISYGPVKVVERDSTRKSHVADALVARAIDFMTANAAKGLSVTEVADGLRVSQRLLEARFKKTLHRSVLKEIRRHQLDRVTKILRETNCPIGEIAERCGFLSESRLSVNFRKRFGVSMTAYRARHATNLQTSKE